MFADRWELRKEISVQVSVLFPEHRPQRVSGSISRGAASADQGQAGGPPDQTSRGHHANTGDRFDGDPEAQSRTGHAGNPRHDGQAEARQARSRAAPATIASTNSRRPKKKSGARDRTGRRRCQAAKEGVSQGNYKARFAKRITPTLLVGVGSLGAYQAPRALPAPRTPPQVSSGHSGAALFSRRRCSSCHSSEPRA